ncbi:MAG: hypothetical protein C0399_05240 [Syntrophus sp. (in: bacteria)]|nr:hypothetical protein [Syntrophus sp. (in: bacteria)]
MKGCGQENPGCAFSGVSPCRLIGPNAFLKEQNVPDSPQKLQRNNSKKGAFKTSMRANKSEAR